MTMLARPSIEAARHAVVYTATEETRSWRPTVDAGSGHFAASASLAWTIRRWPRKLNDDRGTVS